MYVKHIPQHNNLSPTSLLITLTLTAFVAGATNQPDIQIQTGNKLRARRVRPMKPSIYTVCVCIYMRNSDAKVLSDMLI